MKTMLLFATVAALSACTPKAENAAEAANTVTTENATTETATTNTAAPVWTGFEPGTYVVTEVKGKYDVKIDSDGVFTRTDAAGKMEGGTFDMKGAKGCFTANRAPEMCYTNSTPGADGSWSATADDGTKVTVAKKTG